MLLAKSIAEVKSVSQGLKRKSSPERYLNVPSKLNTQKRPVKGYKSPFKKGASASPVKRRVKKGMRNNVREPDSQASENGSNYKEWSAQGSF